MATKRVLSIETGAWWTKVALTEPYKRSPMIQELFYFRTPEGTVEDGMLRDRERFLTALKEELTRREITERDVIFVINSTKVISREISIPTVKDKQLPSIVNSQAKEYFPMDISEYTVTYKKMDEYTDEGGKRQLKLLLIAVPDSLLNNYLTLAKNGGFVLEAFEYIGNSIVSFANAHYTVDSVIVQMEENATIVSIVAGKKLMFQRVAPNGYGSTLNTILSHPVLGVENAPQAYHFLTTHNVIYKRPKLSAVITPEDEQRQQDLENAYADIRESLSYQIRVALTALEYYRNQTKKEFFGVLRLVGDGARIAGIKKLFTDEIPLELSEEDTLSQLHLAKTISRTDAAEVDFVSVVGALIAPLAMKPKDMIAKEMKRSNMKVAWLAFAACALASLGLSSYGVMQYMSASSEHDRLTKRINELQYIHQVYNENEAAKAQATEYLTFDALTYTPNEMLSDLINALERELPPTIVVQTLNINNSTISLSMTSPDKLTVAELLLNLYNIPYIGNVSVPSMAETQDELGNISWQYSVIANYVIPTEDSEDSGNLETIAAEDSATAE